jgi:hypothetical protein
MSLAWALNTAWMLAGAGEACAFHRATRQVRLPQGRLLRDLLRRNRDTWYGKKHGFARLRSPADYQKFVPLMTTDTLAAATERIAAGEASVLTAEPVLRLLPTSGTTAGEKLIPCTATLLEQFQRAVAVWIANLFWQRPAVRRGRAYWSISPALPPQRSPGGLDIGFDDDASYLGKLEQAVLRHLLIGPPAEVRAASLKIFRVATLAALLGAPDLALVSVWSPTFLTALLSLLSTERDRVLSLLGKERRDEVVRVLEGPGHPGEQLRRLWPRLALVSCWTDAAAALPARELAALLPGVEIQPKGLLATEGVVSFPLVGREGAALAVRSHFFEMQEADNPGCCRLAHQLDRGGRYRVILTTGGGLYRYPLNDEVEVLGFEQQCPLLRFCGKGDRTSDLVGEKLAEPHVRTVLERALARHVLEPAFALLVPQEGSPPRYVLYLQGVPHSNPALAADVQAGLEENPHYRLAVRLGQLAPVQVVVLANEIGPAWRIYEQRCLERGQRAGDIKPAALDGWTGWAELFGLARPRG